MGTIMAIIFLIFYVGIIVFFVAAYWKTYAKAGQPGWACLIPIYNYLVLADIARVSRSHVWKAMAVGIVGYVIYMYLILSNQGDMQMMFIALAVIMVTAILSLIFMYPVFKGVALNFGQSAGFAWGLMFLNVIFFAILGFGSAQYQGENGFRNDDILDAEL